MRSPIRILAAILLGGCASVTSNTATTPAAYLDLSEHDVMMSGAATLQLTATVYDSVGNVLAGVPVAWFTADPAIVTVSTTGLVTPTGVGTTWVRARSGNARDSALVTAVLDRVALSGMPFGIAVHPGGTAYVTQANLGSVSRFDVAAGTATGSATVGTLPTSVALDQAGTRAYVGNQNGGGVSVVNTGSNTVIGTVPIPGGVLAVGIAPGDSILLVGTDIGRLYFVRLSSLAVVDSIAMTPYNNAIAFRDTLAFVVATGDATISVINLKTRSSPGAFPVGGSPRGLAVSANGSELYVANEVGELQYWSVATHSKLGATALPGGGGFEVARNPQNGYLYVATSYFGACVHVIDPATRQIVRVIRTGGVPRRIGFTSAGRGIVANEYGWVDVIR